MLNFVDMLTSCWILKDPVNLLHALLTIFSERDPGFMLLAFLPTPKVFMAYWV